MPLVWNASDYPPGAPYDSPPCTSRGAGAIGASVRAITGIILHHTVTDEHAGPSVIEELHAARGISRPGGYHWLVHRHFEGGPWTVSPMRPESKMGAHDKGQNQGTIGVSIAGRYHEDPVPADGWDVLVIHVAELCRRYRLPVAAVEGHAENEPASTPTLCPGYDPAELRRALLCRIRRVQ